MLHYTAIKARRRPQADLDRAQFAAFVDADVRAFVAAHGAIPSALSLCLQNLASPRPASWDILIGRDGTVVQCNLHPSTRKTWHAGRRAGSMPTRDLTWNGKLVWDAGEQAFRHPTLPDGTVMKNGNDATIGIELECWGRLRFSGGQWRIHGGRAVDVDPDDVLRSGAHHYERLTGPQLAALVSVAGAYRDAFEIAPAGWYRHSEIRPDKKIDPEPPLDVAALVAELYGIPAPEEHPPIADAEALFDEVPEGAVLERVWDPDDADGEPDSTDER